MPNKSALLIVVVRERGLRSALVARLSLAGADLVTLDDIDDPALERVIRSPAVLVIDEALAAEHSDAWLESLLADPRWRSLVLLTVDPPSQTATDPRILRVAYSNAAAAIAELVSL